MEFKSADEVLRWAYRNTDRPILKLSGIYSMRGPASTAPDMSPFERRAQAAQIIGMVESLDAVERFYVQANYGRVMTAESAEALRRVCRAALTPIRAERGIDLVLTNYLGKYVGWAEMRQGLECRKNDIPTIRDQIFGALDALHSQVMLRLEARFRMAGVMLDEKS